MKRSSIVYFLAIVANVMSMTDGENVTARQELKIFGVGFKKTATESLLNAYERLGLGRACDEVCRSRAAAVWSGSWKTGERRLGGVLRVAQAHDFFQDSPWCDAAAPLYPALSQAFPRARFVLTVRPTEQWWSSVFHWLTCVKPDKRREYSQLLGVSDVDEKAFTAAYERHNANVIKFFGDQPERLLVVDLTDPNATSPWAQLCRFFRVTTDCPTGALPHRHNQHKKMPHAPPSACRGKPG